MDKSLRQAFDGAFTGFDADDPRTGVPKLQVGRAWSFDGTRPEWNGDHYDNNDHVLIVSPSDCKDSGEMMAKVYMGVAEDLRRLRADEQAKGFMARPDVELSYQVGVWNPRVRLEAQARPIFLELATEGLNEFASNPQMSAEALTTHQSTAAFMQFVAYHAEKCGPWYKKDESKTPPADGPDLARLRTLRVPKDGVPMYTQQPGLFGN